MAVAGAGAGATNGNKWQELKLEPGQIKGAKVELKINNFGFATLLNITHYRVRVNTVFNIQVFIHD